jgi:hypothetical protein
MSEDCGRECEIDEEEIAEAAEEQAMAMVLGAATTEQLRDELRSRGYRVILEDR